MKLSPELTCKLGVAIRDDGSGHAVQAENVVEEQSSDVGSGVRGLWKITTLFSIRTSSSNETREGSLIQWETSINIARLPSKCYVTYAPTLIAYATWGNIVHYSLPYGRGEPGSRYLL